MRPPARTVHIPPHALPYPRQSGDDACLYMLPYNGCKEEDINKAKVIRLDGDDENNIMINHG